ncbi:MAG: type II toxin-antitoxin system VapC family toxin [Acidobacteriota bacterium]
MAVRAEIALDTNILLRLPFDSPAELTTASRALYHLAARGFTFCTTVASIAEFANSASRPTQHNGLGLSVAQVQQRIRFFERRFPIFVESMQSYDIWKALVQKYEVKGTRVHDARIASIMMERRVRAILTLNPSDFVRFREIITIHPEDILRGA